MNIETMIAKLEREKDDSLTLSDLIRISGHPHPYPHTLYRLRKESSELNRLCLRKLKVKRARKMSTDEDVASAVPCCPVCGQRPRQTNTKAMAAIRRES